MQKNTSPNGFLPSFQHFATQAIHVGQEPEQWNSRDVVLPISLATTFKQDSPGQSSVSGRAGRTGWAGWADCGNTRDSWVVSAILS